MGRRLPNARAPAPDDGERDRLRLWIKLFETVHAIEREVRSRLRSEFSCTLPQFDVLAALDRAQTHMTMGELSRWLKVSNGNVTGVVERLIKDGTVSRQSRPGDRRTSLVAMTPRGQRLFDRMAAANKRWIDEMLGGIDDDAVRALIGGLDRIGRTGSRAAASKGGLSDENERART